MKGSVGQRQQLTNKMRSRRGKKSNSFLAGAKETILERVDI